MPVRHIEPAYVDDRGVIADILENELIHHVTLITSRRGATRGNHYHNETIQYLYMIEGRMRLTTQMPGRGAESVILSKGDLAVNVPAERHAMRALEDSVFMVFTKGPRGGREFESDTYRLSKDELLEPADQEA